MDNVTDRKVTGGQKQKNRFHGNATAKLILITAVDTLNYLGKCVVA